MAHRILDPASLTAAERYDLLASTIVPRPIALVSSLGPNGEANLAPFSFFMPGGVNPMSIAFSPTLNMNGEPKDTLSNVEQSREFTVNLVDRHMAEGMNSTSFQFPREVSEWSVAGFTGIAGTRVACCRIAESAVAFECRLFEIVRHGREASAAVYVIGEVLAAIVDESKLNGEYHPIGRLGGADYIDLASGSIFELNRPR